MRLGYWQLARHDYLVALAQDQVTVRTEIPSDRGTIYDRSGTVALATTVSRDRLVAFPAQLAGDGAEAVARRAAIAARLAEILGLDGTEGSDAPRAARLGPGLRRPGPRPHPGPVDGRPGGDRRRAHLPGPPRGRGGARLPARGRRAEDDPRGPRPRLRQPRGRRPVRGGGPLAGRRWPARRGSSSPSATPRASRTWTTRAGPRGRQPRRRPHADDRREPPAGRRARGLRGLGRRPGQERVRGGDGPPDRRDPGPGHLPVVRRQRLPGRGRGRSGPLRRPRRLGGLRAGLRLQDGDRRRGPRGRAS